MLGVEVRAVAGTDGGLTQTEAGGNGKRLGDHGHHRGASSNQPLAACRLGSGSGTYLRGDSGSLEVHWD